MQISKLAKGIRKYLPLLAVLAATVIGLVVGKNLYSASLDSQRTNPAQLTLAPGDSPRLTLPGTMGQCPLSSIYLSLPPKCRTSDGSFIPVPGTAPYIMIVPEGK